VRWRLLSANNRQLGRGPVPYADELAAWAAAGRLVLGLHRAETALLRVRVPGPWTWRLLLDDEVLAVSGRDYERAPAAAQALQLFVRALPDAVRGSPGPPG
jgi:hypothetical protein